MRFTIIKVFIKLQNNTFFYASSSYHIIFLITVLNDNYSDLNQSETKVTPQKEIQSFIFRIQGI